MNSRQNCLTPSTPGAWSDDGSWSTTFAANTSPRRSNSRAAKRSWQWACAAMFSSLDICVSLIVGSCERDGARRLRHWRPRPASVPWQAQVGPLGSRASPASHVVGTPYLVRCPCWARCSTGTRRASEASPGSAHRRPGIQFVGQDGRDQPVEHALAVLGGLGGGPGEGGHLLDHVTDVRREHGRIIRRSSATMAPCSSRARVARSEWRLASASASCRGQSSIEQPRQAREGTICAPGTPQHPWRLHERAGDVMPLEPGQAVRLIPWAVPRLDTSWLIAANHDVAAPGSPGTAGQPHGAQPMLTRFGPSALICPPAHSPVGRETPPGWCLVDSRGFVGLRPVPPAALQARQRRVDPVSCPCKYLRRSTSTSPATVRPSTDIPFGAAGTST